MAATFFGGFDWDEQPFKLPATYSERDTCPQCETTLLSSETPDDVAKLVTVLSETPPNVTRKACPKCGYASELIQLHPPKQP